MLRRLSLGMRLPCVLVAVGALVLHAGCGVERLDDVPDGRSLPEDVAMAFDESCNRGAGMLCHSNNAAGIEFDDAGSFIEAPGLVSPGDLDNSRVSQVIEEGSMPPDGFLEGREADRFILLGWIAAGAELELVDDAFDPADADPERE